MRFSTRAPCLITQATTWLVLLLGRGVRVTTPELGHMSLGNRDAHSYLFKISLDLRLVIGTVDAGGRLKNALPHTPSQDMSTS